MDQQLRLPLETGEPFPNGLSAWLRGKPPFIGWWDTRVIVQMPFAPRRVPLIERRWWSPAGWSVPVMCPDDEIAAHLAKHCLSSAMWSLIEYRGLASPPKEGYSWALDAHHRSNLATVSRARVPLAV